MCGQQTPFSPVVNGHGRCCNVGISWKKRTHLTSGLHCPFWPSTVVQNPRLWPRARPVRASNRETKLKNIFVRAHWTRRRLATCADEKRLRSHFANIQNFGSFLKKKSERASVEEKKKKNGCWVWRVLFRFGCWKEKKERRRKMRICFRFILGVGDVYHGGQRRRHYRKIGIKNQDFGGIAWKLICIILGSCSTWSPHIFFLNSPL